MVRLTPLLQTPAALLARLDHPPELPHCDPPQEAETGTSINFVERGRFELRAGKRRWRLSAGMVFVTRPGQLYRYHHFEPRPTDVCLSVGYRSGWLEEAESTRLLSAKTVVLPINNRLAYLHWRLGHLGGVGGTALEAEALAAELLAAVTEKPAGRGTKLFRAHQLAWYAERVQAARALLDSRYHEPHTLSALALTVGMSPFHFARVFRQLVSLPPHRYLLRVRLARACQRLRGGASVTETCFASGFNNLSHFIRLFRRAYGVSPSQFRRQSPRSRPVPPRLPN